MIKYNTPIHTHTHVCYLYYGYLTNHKRNLSSIYSLKYLFTGDPPTNYKSKVMM